MSRLVYIAHPIDQRNHALGQNINHSDIERALIQCGFDQFWPEQPWVFAGSLTDSLRETVHAVNEVAQHRAWATLALLPDDTPTLGVPAEIERALNNGQEVAIIAGPGVQGSVQLHDWTRRGAHVTDNPHDAASWLVKASVGVGTPNGDEGQGNATEGPRTANGDLLFKMDPGCEYFMPQRVHEGDAGFDLYASKSGWVDPGVFQDIPCGCSVELPPGWWGWITGRSSTLRKRHLLVTGGVIDQGYRGPLFVGVQNLSTMESVKIEAGERLAQFIPLPLFPGTSVPVDGLGHSARGNNGFGSTGR